jgi:predicted protein tyrosine phosphatase
VDLHWIDLDLPAGFGRLAVMPHPRGDDALSDEADELLRLGVDVVVSLLEPDEAASIGLRAEGDACRARGLQFVAFPIPDRSVPSSMEEAADLVEHLRQAVEGGRSVVFHCWAGIGRSSLMAASLLAAWGMEPEQAFSRIGQARGWEVPDTAVQWRWVQAFAHFLERRGVVAP